MKLVTTELLPEFEYFKEARKKTQIVLHHTVSSIGKFVDDWFKADKGKSKVAVSYVVDKDGTVFKLFEPEYWAWHIGRGSTKKDNQNSIGIELVNEGVLDKVGDEFFWFDGKQKFNGDVVQLENSWRGVEYFAGYTDEQVLALFELLQVLFVKFPIVHRRFSNTFDYNDAFFNYNGVVMHCNLRKDKTDLSPAFPIEQLENFINEFETKEVERKIKPLPVELIPFAETEYAKYNEQLKEEMNEVSKQQSTNKKRSNKK